MTEQRESMQPNAELEERAGARISASLPLPLRAGDRMSAEQAAGSYSAPPQSRGDRIFKTLTGTCAVFVLLLILAIFVELLINSWPSVERFGWGFLTSNEWNPVIRELDDGRTIGPVFGAASSIYGTLVSTAIALVLAVPIGLITALFLVELAPPRISRIVGTGVELLAAIPSIIYGMWGLFVFAPFLANYVYPGLQRTLGEVPFVKVFFAGSVNGLGMLTAGIILSIMVLPFITAVARDVFNMVPPALKESAYGMGATTWEVTRKVTIRYGFKGVIGAALLGLGRAIGETMAVTFVIGNSHRISASLLENGNTITSTLANEFQEAAAEPMYRAALIELGLILFVLTFGIQALAQLWLRRVSRGMGGGL
jgi:phosphate transport system permease protein